MATTTQPKTAETTTAVQAKTAKSILKSETLFIQILLLAIGIIVSTPILIALFTSFKPPNTAFIPHSDSSERNGVIIGGAALWLIDSGDEAQNAAAWQFMKFMAAPDQQVTWHTGSGYFPVRADLADNPELNTFWDENPNFRTAIEQLATTNTTLDDGSPNYPVLGGRAGPFPAIRQILVETYSRVLDDDLSPQEALDEAAEKANEELANYNAFFE